MECRHLRIGYWATTGKLIARTVIGVSRTPGSTPVSWQHQDGKSSEKEAMQIPRHQLLGDHCEADSKDGNEMLSRRGSAEQGPHSDEENMPANVLRT